MASIRDFAFTEGTVAASSYTPDMPAHETGDLLLVLCNADAVGYNSSSANGWNAEEERDNGGQGSAIYWLIATSSSMTPPTIIHAGTDTYTCTVLAIRDVDTNSPISAIAARLTDDTTIPFDGVDTYVANDNSLIISFLSTDGGIGPVVAPGWVNLVNGDAGSNSGGVAYTFKRVGDDTVLAHPWYARLGDNTVCYNIVIKDSGSLVTVPPYLQPGNTTGALLVPGEFAATDAWGNTYPTALSLATVGSKNATYDQGAVVADAGLNPYWGALSCTPSGTSNGSGVGGPQIDFNTAKDLTGSILFYNYMFASPRDYVDVSTSTDTGQVGMLVVLRDANDNYNSWSVGTKNSVTTKPDGWNVTCIQADQTQDTNYAASGTLDLENVASILLLAQGRYGSVAWRASHICIGYEQPIAGGTASNPLTLDNLDTLLNSCLGAQRVMIREGSAATFLLPIRFGGVDPVHINVQLRALQFRTQSDTLDYFDWHVDDNFVGFEFDGQANDTMNFVGCVFTGASPYYWRFSADHSASANVDFTGCTIVNATVTLRSTVSLDTVTFTNCPSFIQNNAALENCTFNGTLVTSDNLADITNCSFVSDGSGHAIDLGTINSTSSVTWENVATGYDTGATGSPIIPTNTGNEIITVNVPSGVTLTINVAAGATVPSIRNTAGTPGTINVVAGLATLNLTGLVANSEVRIYSAGTTTELDGVENSGTSFAFTYTYAASTFVDIVVHKADYKYVRIEGYLLGPGDASLPIQQIFDRNYFNP